MKRVLLAFLGVFLSTMVVQADESYTVLQKPSLMIMGIECRTSNAPEAAPKDIPQHWGRFFAENVSARIPNKSSDEVISLYCDYVGDYTQPYTCVIGCLVSSAENVPEGMVVKVLPASSYALFRAVGEPPASVVTTWEKIWQTTLKRTYAGDFEVYGEKFAGDPKEVDILIAIE